MPYFRFKDRLPHGTSPGHAWAAWRLFRLGGHEFENAHDFLEVNMDSLGKIFR